MGVCASVCTLNYIHSYIQHAHTQTCMLVYIPAEEEKAIVAQVPVRTWEFSKVSFLLPAKFWAWFPIVLIFRECVPGVFTQVCDWLYCLYWIHLLYWCYWLCLLSLLYLFYFRHFVLRHKRWKSLRIHIQSDQIVLRWGVGGDATFYNSEMSNIKMQVLISRRSYHNACLIITDLR